MHDSPGGDRRRWLSSFHGFELLESRVVLTAGALDPTFGDGGTVLTDFPSTAPSYDYGRSVAVQTADGKTLVAGTSQPFMGGNNTLALARYNTDGGLDVTFGSAGRFSQTIGSSPISIGGLALQADGKIVLAGGVNDEFLVVRLDVNGALDVSFDGDGWLTTDFGAANDYATSVAVQADGRIVVAGVNGFDFVVARYESNGALDASFDSDGLVTTDFGGTYDSAQSVTVQPDGKIVVAGYSAFDLDIDFAVARYESTGALDASFDSDGLVTTDFGDYDYALSVAVQADGKIVVAGMNGSDFAVSRYESSGTLDASFDSDGLVTTDLGGTYDYASSVAVQPDGRIVVAGASSSTFAVARYASNGVLDASFDSDGLVTTDFGGAYEQATSVAVQSDGKIVVAGYSASYGVADFAIARYESSGVLDASFDMDGRVTTDFPSGVPTYDYGNSATIQQGDGKILVAGTSQAYGSPHMTLALVRYDADGSLDSTFGSAGRVNHTLDASYISVSGVALQTDGKIVLAGDINGDFLVVRLNVNGALDTSFDGDGWLATDFGGTYDYANSVAVQSDGKIVVAGYSSYYGSDFAVARYESNGALDASFDSDGLVTTDFGGTYDYAKSVAVQPDGKIVVAGYSSYYDVDFAVARYESNGLLDASFDSDGLVTTDFGGAYYYAHSVAIQPDGKIVVAGYSAYYDVDFAVARYASNGVLDDSFDSDGLVTTDFGGTYDYAHSVAVQSDGKIVVAGYSSYDSSDFAVARYASNGVLDPSFDSDGLVTTDFGGAYDYATSVAVQADGKIVVVGYSSYDSSDFALARYIGDGDVNQPPTADAGGPYVVGEGTPITLDGGGSIDDHGIATYEWDLDYDGITFDVDLVTTSSTIAFTFADDFSRLIALRTSDANGLNDIDTTLLTVHNAVPDATDNNYSTPQAVLVSGNLIADGTADSDPAGALDPLTVVAVNGVAADVGQTIPTANGTLIVNASGAFTYQPDTTFSGTETFTYRISDGDGGYDIATVTIIVTPAPGGSIQTVTETCCGSGTALLVTGSEGAVDDTIVVEPGSTNSTLKVTVNGISTSVARPSGRIIVMGGDGNDNIQIAGAITNSVWLYGDGGHDRLDAGNASLRGNLLIGGDGNDQLLGGSGRDIMIGGEGADKLVANSDDDILVAGYTTQDARSSINHEEFWCKLLEEWNSNRLFATRVTNLAPLLLPQVIDDVFTDAVDFLNGSSGDDWLIFAAGEDRVSGKAEMSN